MDKHAKYTFNLVGAMQSTLDEDSEFFIAGIEEIDATEYFTSILSAATYVFNELVDDNKNNIEMSHVLNSLAVQQAVKQATEQSEGDE